MRFCLLNKYSWLHLSCVTFCWKFFLRFNLPDV